jgi:adenosine deaminase
MCCRACGGGVLTRLGWGLGVRSVGDQALVDRLRRDRIPLEMCPLSNTHTGSVASLPEHPADRLLAAGLAVTISTDARTTSDTTLGREFAALAAEFGWTAEHERRCQDHARAAVFGSAGAEQVDEAGDRAVR